MKKYIAPIARNINIETESIIAMSTQEGLSSFENQLSNKRQRSASDVIWGFDDEADREY